MRKELIIAIIFGVAIGVIIAFGIWRANSALSSSEESLQTNEALQTQNETEPQNTAQLTIAQPEEDEVLTETPIKITGITKPNITLVISGEEKDYIVKTANDGTFDQEVDLVGGVNEIIFAQADDTNAGQTKTLRVVYSTEFQEEEEE